MKEVHAVVLDPTHLELSEPVSVQTGESVYVLIQDATNLHDLGKVDRQFQEHLTRQFREREILWCQANPSLLESHAGKWVVVEGEAIVGIGSTPQQAAAQAKSEGVEIPYVFFVEPTSPDVVRIGL